MGLPHFVLLYVDEPEKSAAFYARLLDRQPLESSPTFVMFELAPDLRLGLWVAQRGSARAARRGRHRGTGDGGWERERGRGALRRLEAQRRRYLAGASYDGLRPDLSRRRPGRTPASGILPGGLIFQAADWQE